MRTTFISTRSMSEATRQSLLKSQVKLADASKEAVTGRHSDVGIALGYKTGQAVSFRQDVTRLESITASNGTAAARLDVTQAALTGIKEAADKFQQSVLLAISQPGSSASLIQEATTGLSALVDKANTAYEGAYVFAGINSDVRPMNQYVGTATQTQVQTAFAALGPPESITPAAMQAFLDGPFASIFTGTGWTTNMSNASSTNIKSRISTSEMIETSTNANVEPFQQLTMAYAMLSDLSNAQLSPATQKVIAQKASNLVTGATTGLSTLQSVLAVPQQRISDSNDRMAIQKDLFTSRIKLLEGVDENEASVRVTALEQQINLSYAITGKLQALNILDYL